MKEKLRLFLNILLYWFLIGWFIFINYKTYQNNKKIENFIVKFREDISAFELDNEKKYDSSICEDSWIKVYYDCLKYFEYRDKLYKLNYKIKESDYNKYIIKNSKNKILENLKNASKIPIIDMSIIEKVKKNKEFYIKHNCKENFTYECKENLIEYKKLKPEIDKINKLHNTYKQIELDNILYDYFNSKNNVLKHWKEWKKEYFLSD